MPYSPPHLSETLVRAPWRWCNLCAATMGANKASRGEVPATIAEVQRLEDAIGAVLPGYNAAQVISGQLALYGRAPARWFTPWATTRAQLLSPGLGLVLYGWYQRLPLAIRSHSAQPTYAGKHAIYVQWEGPEAASVAVNDPLSRSGPIIVSVDALRAFSESLAGEHLIYVEGSFSLVTTITIERTFDPPRAVRFTGPRTYYGYQPSNPNPAAHVGIDAGGSSAPIDAVATITQSVASAIPHGTFARVTAGPLARLWVPVTGLQLPPPDDAAADLEERIGNATIHLNAALRVLRGEPY